MPFSAIIMLWLTFRALVNLGFTLHLASGDRVDDRMLSGWAGRMWRGWLFVAWVCVCMARLVACCGGGCV